MNIKIRIPKPSLDLASKYIHVETKDVITAPTNMPVSMLLSRAKNKISIKAIKLNKVM